VRELQESRVAASHVRAVWKDDKQEKDRNKEVRKERIIARKN
jgi:hypothetical protein